MRCAIISDLHANLQAWKAVLLDIRSQKLDRIVCLGDLVGYGPNPAEVLEAVYANVDGFVLGNHDAALCGKMDAAQFNEGARQIIEWSASRLSRDAVRFLASLPLTLKAESFRCAHAGFVSPASFDYVIEPGEALRSLRAVPEPLLFVGHTHQPGIFVVGRSGTPHRLAPQDFQVEAGKRYLVNVGSVGQPRDGEARACYCILDTETPAVYWRRVPFDLDAYRDALRQAGLDERASYFLRADPRQGVPPLRELLHFAPAETPNRALRNTPEVRELETLRRSVRKWRALYAVTTVALLAAVAAGVWLGWRHAHRAVTLAETTHPEAREAAQTAPGTNLAELPGLRTVPGRPVPGWEVRIGNRHKQWVAIDAVEGGTGMLIRSHTPSDPVAAVATPVRVEPGMRLCMQALFRKSEPFEGDVALALGLTRRNDGAETLDREFQVKAPNPNVRRGGWMLAKSSFELPAGATSVQLELRGQFRGDVYIKDVSLTRVGAGD